MANPADLNITPQPDTDKNFFNFKAVGLKINKTYAIKFQWIYDDLTLSDWSPGFFVTTSNETAPAVPSSASVPGSATGSIPVTLSAFPTNAKRVDVVITNGIFGTATVAHSFTTAGTITIAAPAGTYIVQLRSISPTGVTSTVGTTFTITIADVGETIQAPTNPNGFSIDRVLSGIQVNWAGTYANVTFTGFEAIKIYVGNSATFTNGTYREAGVMTGNNVKNTITIPVDGTYLRYDLPVYIHAAGVNKSGTLGTIQVNVANDSLGARSAIASDLANQIITNAKLVDDAVTTAKIATNAITAAKILAGTIDVSKLAAGTISVNNLEAGLITATSYIRAGGSTGARVELSSSNISGGPSAGFYIYNSAGTAILSAPLTGGLSITGGGSFTGDISGASGVFAGNLSSSNGQFSVTSGSISALSGSIGNWQINSGVLKSGAEAFPKVLLDPINSQIVLRETNGASDSGNFIKLDPSVGIKVGTTALTKFTVAMNGNMSATDATFNSGSFNGSITSSATITGGIINGATVTSSSNGDLGTVRLNSSNSSFEVLGANGSVYGQIYSFLNGNELIIRHGNTRSATNYPTNSAMLSLNSTSTNLGYTDGVGNGGSSWSIKIASDGDNKIRGTLGGFGKDGNITLNEFRNITAGSAVQSTSSSFNGNGGAALIGDIYIQY